MKKERREERENHYVSIVWQTGFGQMEADRSGFSSWL